MRSSDAPVGLVPAPAAADDDAAYLLTGLGLWRGNSLTGKPVKKPSENFDGFINIVSKSFTDIKNAYGRYSSANAYLLMDTARRISKFYHQEEYFYEVHINCAVILVRKGEGQLEENFYRSSCPNVEDIVRKSVITKIIQTPITIPATLRLFFHDCFVEGCDASILIASPNNDAEKDAKDNLSLAGDGFDTVIKAKQAVEAQCRAMVSCADILAIAARDVVFLAGGPTFNVELGRRDGLISRASRVAGHLPEPEFDLAQLNAMFGKNNLSQTDMIALSGSHTLGFSHCDRFSKRIYSFSRTNPIDPTLDPNYAQQLISLCPKNAPSDVVVNLDPVTPATFDNVYFQNLIDRKGLFTSDQVLFTELASQSTVKDFANDSGRFNVSFVTAMRKLGRVRVKTGDQGEIRTDCTAFNS
ncbi:peroxidase 55 [Phtheirospermum japonicum]|uniref:Peroxidase n=1 Tax=Phtheirospermum japonicum TaxID=374723 RepID=A0A830C794_9LAMI|nr:peroxidase 55 [Phtheirospermum japonicum]